jgi:hypothetical protein
VKKTDFDEMSEEEKIAYNAGYSDGYKDGSNWKKHKDDDAYVIYVGGDINIDPAKVVIGLIVAIVAFFALKTFIPG